jgi:class 3 adenylate cyclase
MTFRFGWPRLSLFKKYLLVLFATASIPLLINGLTEAWFGYGDQREMIDARLKVESRAAASEIEGFVDSIRDQMGWVVQLSWTDNTGAHHLDALRLFRQVPAVVELTLADGEGRERVRISRFSEDVLDSQTDLSANPAFVGARDQRVWYGPVTLNRGSEPYMRIAVAGNRLAVGVAIAEINLTLIRDVISAIRVGNTGLAFVVDGGGRLVAHPDISLMLRGTDEATLLRLQALRTELLASGGEPIIAVDFGGRQVIAAAAAIEGLDWLVVAELPTSEAYAPIAAAAWRTGLLLLGAAGLALILAYLLAHHMTGPIQLLADGAAEIGAGRFDHKIDLRSGDELATLAGRFNQMAGDLALSKERSERIARLKRFLSPQVADMVERSGDGDPLEARRADVVVVFADLRGFTEFSAKSMPDEIMWVLGEYYDALGQCIVRNDATLTHFSGDGVMVLLNAPLPCADDPVQVALRMAREMHLIVRVLIDGWRSHGYEMGFGIGLAKGEATVGRVGYEGRHDYTAIGRVVNLASRLCSSAHDGQILMDEETAKEVYGEVALELGTRSLKGFSDPVVVYSAT